VSGIAGQTRVRLEFVGKAGHAGTTPMPLRHDALCAAAEFVLAVERCGVTATVGQIEVQPGASNVIPGRTSLSLDVRDLVDRKRKSAVAALRADARAIGRRRGVTCQWKPIQEARSVVCDARLVALMSKAVSRHQPKVLALSSGAGHDAVAMAAVCPVAMLFVRCKDGLSHHPAESVRTRDVQVALAVLRDFVLNLAA
jgi:allantoate deiminase